MSRQIGALKPSGAQGMNIYYIAADQIMLAYNIAKTQSIELGSNKSTHLQSNHFDRCLLCSGKDSCSQSRLKSWCWEPPGHYLCTPWLTGLRNLHTKKCENWTPRAQRRDWWENEVCFIYPTAWLKSIILGLVVRMTEGSGLSGQYIGQSCVCA